MISWQQEWILRVLLEHYQLVEEHGNDHQKRCCEVWGMNWRPAKWQSPVFDWTPSIRASVSRALRRLEMRSLVIRNNQRGPGSRTKRSRMSLEEPSPKRTDCLKLTEAGRELAERLTKIPPEFVNQ